MDKQSLPRKTVLFSDGEKNSFANLDNYFPNLVRTSLNSTKCVTIRLNSATPEHNK